jgi:hypothetical protein
MQYIDIQVYESNRKQKNEKFAVPSGPPQFKKVSDFQGLFFCPKFYDQGPCVNHVIILKNSITLSRAPVSIFVVLYNQLFKC